MQDNEKIKENAVGIGIYSTPEIDGIGGVYKNSYKDFIVKEITRRGYILQIKNDYQSPPFSEDSKDFCLAHSFRSSTA